MTLRSWVRSPLLILLAVFLFQWLLLFSMREPTWDAVSYYAYARSVIFDQDLSFANDYRLSYPTAGDHFASKEFDQETTITGRVVSPFAIGSPLMWLPWLAILRYLSLFAPLADGSVRTGYEWYFTGSINILSAFIGFLAFWVSYRLAKEVVNQRLALIATITLMFATPLIFYQFREPMYSHTASALTVALIIFVWWKQQGSIGSAWQALTLGALIGLGGLVRWQNLTYLFLPIFSTAIIWLKLPSHEKKLKWSGALWYLLLTGATALAVFAMQMSVWKLLYGSFVTIPQGGVYVDWRAPFLAPVLFSTFRGILPWMPVFLLAFIGLLGLSKRRPHLGVPLIVMLFFAIYVTASTRDWFGGGGYGPRRLTSELTVLILGYTAFLDLFPRRWQLWLALPIGFVLAIHQWLLLRFGLPNSLGGRVLSMSPTWRWEDTSLFEFFTDLGAYLPTVGTHPLEFLILPGSVLDLLWRQQVWPGQHVITLLATAVFLLLLFLAARYLYERIRKPAIIFGILALFLLLANLWILIWA